MFPQIRPSIIGGAQNALRRNAIAATAGELRPVRMSNRLARRAVRVRRVNAEGALRRNAEACEQAQQEGRRA